MGFTVTHNHQISYKVDGELRPDEVDILNRLIESNQKLADALNAAQNKENVPELKDPKQKGGLSILQRTNLATPVRLPLGASRCSGNFSPSPTSIITSSAWQPKLADSLVRRETSPSVLVRSSSLAPTDAPSTSLGQEGSNHFENDATDAMSTICVANFVAGSQHPEEDAQELCLQVECPPGNLQSVCVKVHTRVADLRHQLGRMTRIPANQQEISYKDPQSLRNCHNNGRSRNRNRELLTDWATLEDVSIATHVVCSRKREVRADIDVL